jgi:hypothetical protein
MRHQRKRLFGVALDASDDPWSLKLKLASMMARGEGRDLLYSDPYDALVKDVADFEHLELVGKFPIPSWLGVRPQLSDLHLVNVKNLQQFVANGVLLEIMKGYEILLKGMSFPRFP